MESRHQPQSSSRARAGKGTSLPEFTVGLAARKAELAHLVSPSEGAAQAPPRLLLLHGMGGIGKTTLARAVCIDVQAEHADWQARRAESQAKYADLKVQHADLPHSFVALEQQMQEADIPQVQQQLLADLAGEAGHRLDSAGQGRQLLAAKLQGRRVLLLVDNAWGYQLATLLPRNITQLLGKGSLVLVTSRMAGLCDSMWAGQGFVRVGVQLLAEEEALELFCWHAYGSSCPPLANKQRVKRVVARCGGLPMALEAAGAHLQWSFNKPRFFAETEAALAFAYSRDQAGRKGSGSTVFAALRRSWEVLEAGEKEALLDIVWFLQGQPWEVVQTCFDYGVLDRLWQQGLLQRVQVQEAELPAGGTVQREYGMLEQLRGGLLAGSVSVDCVSVHATVVAFCKAEGSRQGGQQRLDVDGGAAGVNAVARQLMEVCHVTSRNRDVACSFRLRDAWHKRQCCTLEGQWHSEAAWKRGA
jgi:hypothetical protein